MCNSKNFLLVHSSTCGKLRHLSFWKNLRQSFPQAKRDKNLHGFLKCCVFSICIQHNTKMCILMNDHVSCVCVLPVRKESPGFELSTNSGRLWLLFSRARGPSRWRTVCQGGCCRRWLREICPDCCFFWPTAPRTRSTLSRPGPIRCLVRPCTPPVSWEM